MKFLLESYSKGPKKIYTKNKSNVYYITDIWSSDILDLKDYDPESNRRYRYVVLVIGNFSELRWTLPLENENTQTIKDPFETILITSKRKPKLNESDKGKEFHNNIFQSFLNIKNNKQCSRNTSLGVVYAEKFNRSIRDLLRRPDFEKSESIWIGVLPTITKQYNNRVHTSTKLTPIQASLKKNEGFVYHKLLDKQKKIKPKFKIYDLVRTADLKKTISKSVTSNCSYKLYKNTEIINDTLPSYHLDDLPDCNNEFLLEKTNLTMK